MHEEDLKHSTTLDCSQCLILIISYYCCIMQYKQNTWIVLGTYVPWYQTYIKIVTWDMISMVLVWRKNLNGFFYFLKIILKIHELAKGNVEMNLKSQCSLLQPCFGGLVLTIIRIPSFHLRMTWSIGWRGFKLSEITHKRHILCTLVHQCGFIWKIIWKMFLKFKVWKTRKPEINIFKKVLKFHTILFRIKIDNT